MSFRVEKLRSGREYSSLSIGDYKTNITDMLENGFKPMSIAKAAEHRLDLGVFHQISWTGTRVTELFLSIDNEFYLAKANLRSLLFDPDALDSIQGYNANWNEIRFSESYITDRIKIPEDGLVIPRNDMHINPISKFLFGDLAGPYARWMAEAGIPAFPIAVPNYSLTSRYDNDFIRPLILRCTDNWSGLITANADLHHSYGYRGYATHYTGPVVEEETFTSEQLNPVRVMVPLENRKYSLRELEDAFAKSEYRALFNSVMRMVRNNGTALPANYNTWA